MDILHYAVILACGKLTLCVDDVGWFWNKIYKNELIEFNQLINHRDFRQSWYGKYCNPLYLYVNMTESTLIIAIQVQYASQVQNIESLKSKIYQNRFRFRKIQRCERSKDLPMYSYEGPLQRWNQRSNDPVIQSKIIISEELNVRLPQAASYSNHCYKISNCNTLYRTL